jgi:hypothetical protein
MFKIPVNSLCQNNRSENLEHIMTNCDNNFIFLSFLFIYNILDPTLILKENYS